MEETGAAEVLKRDALGRVTVPRARREALVDEFERSGLPATRFAEAAGINVSDQPSTVVLRLTWRMNYTCTIAL